MSEYHFLGTSATSKIERSEEGTKPVERLSTAPRVLGPDHIIEAFAVQVYFGADFKELLAVLSNEKISASTRCSMFAFLVRHCNSPHAVFRLNDLSPENRQMLNAAAQRAAQSVLCTYKPATPVAVPYNDDSTTSPDGVPGVYCATASHDGQKEVTVVPAAVPLVRRSLRRDAPARKSKPAPCPDPTYLREELEFVVNENADESS